MSDLSSVVSDPRRFFTCSTGVYMNLSRRGEHVVATCRGELLPHLPYSLKHPGVTRKLLHLGGGQLEHSDIPLLGHDSGLDHVDLPLGVDCLGFDLLDELGSIGKTCEPLNAQHLTFCKASFGIDIVECSICA